MKKKPAASTQVRLSPELAKQIDDERDAFGVNVSRPAFVSMLLIKGLKAHRTSLDEAAMGARRLSAMEVDGCRPSKKGLDPAH